MGGPECIQITLATLFHSDSVHGHQRHLLTLQGHQGNCNMAFKDHCISLTLLLQGNIDDQKQEISDKT